MDHVSISSGDSFYRLPVTILSKVHLYSISLAILSSTIILDTVLATALSI